MGKTEGKTVQNELETGLNDGVFIIVTKGVNVGDTIILSASLESKKKPAGKAVANPLMPTRRPGQGPGQGQGQGQGGTRGGGR